MATEEEENDNGGTDENDETDDGGDGGTDDETDDDETDDDEPVDYDGPDHALEGHNENGTASDYLNRRQQEQPCTSSPSSSIGTQRGFRCPNHPLQLTDLRGRTVAQGPHLTGF